MAEKAVPQKNLAIVENKTSDSKRNQKEKEVQYKHSYTFDEAYQASLTYFKGDELAARVWVNKYALKDSSGKIYERTPDDMHRRLASEISRIEQRYANPLSFDELFDLMEKGFGEDVFKGQFLYFTPAGFGDGVYQVYSLLDESGRIVGLECDFNNEE